MMTANVRSDDVCAGTTVVLPITRARAVRPENRVRAAIVAASATSPLYKTGYRVQSGAS